MNKHAFYRGYLEKRALRVDIPPIITQSAKQALPSVHKLKGMTIGSKAIKQQQPLLQKIKKILAYLKDA